jgi:1,2-dihydroxy-3-keto-5-methylthiopentene dioxygenase
MAHIRIQDENREISGPEQIAAFLRPFGIQYERWEVEGRLTPQSSNQDILDVYAPEIDRLKQQGGYVTADVINVSPETPGLDAMLEKFKKEHTHSEDEVRFIVEGSGIFHIHPDGGPVFGLQLEQGDLINVPAGIKHWFDLCSDKKIRAIRLFLDASGWTPHYTNSDKHARYEPVCFGPNYVAPAQKTFASAVKP